MQFNRITPSSPDAGARAKMIYQRLGSEMAYKKPRPLLIDSRMTDLKNALASMLGTTVYRNCLNCNEWNEGKEECKRFNARPPAAIIVYSCEQWEELNDWDIPF